MDLSSFENPISHETLFQDHNKMVAYCYKCKLYHIYLGNVALDLREGDLRDFIIKLHHFGSMYEGNIHPMERSIEIKRNNSGMRMICSLIEIQSYTKISENAIKEHHKRLLQRRYN